MIEPYFLFPFPFYRLLHAYSPCEGKRHAYNAWNTCVTWLPFGSFKFIYLFTRLFRHVIRAIDQPYDRTGLEIAKSEIWNCEITKSEIRFVQKIIPSSPPSQCVQALQPWTSTWIVQLRSPCAPQTLKWSNGFWICLYTPGSWLVLPMWDIS